MRRGPTTGITPRSVLIRLCGFASVLVLLLLISPGIGTQSTTFGWWDAWRAKLGFAIPEQELVGRTHVDRDGDGLISQTEARSFTDLAGTIGFSQRFARSLLAMQVGITLAICGAAFQVLFRNPLATPYTLGIASGGSLGALAALQLGWIAAFAGISGVAVGAFIGAILVVLLVFMIARRSAKLTSNEMLLAGVTLGIFCSAMMMFLTSVSNERETFFMVRWMMGSLDPVRTIEGAVLWPLIVPSWIVLPLCGRALNQYSLGEELAMSRGVNVQMLQVTCIAVSTLATAGVVAQCGPIGFVGLVVPHIVGLLCGTDCRILLPASALTGGAFLIVCDWVSQVSMRAAGELTGKQLGSATLPIGVVTAIVGVPIFLALLRGRRLLS